MKYPLMTMVMMVSLAVAPLTTQAASTSDTMARLQALVVEMASLQKEFLTLSASLTATTPAPAVLGVASSTSVFTHSLDYGVTNDDIAKIQRLLATDPEIYKEGTVSGFFGPKTKEAIRLFQTRIGLDPVGIIGPATKTMLEAYLRKYPDEKYPEGVLKTKPMVAGASTSAGSSSVPAVSTPAVTPKPTPSTENKEDEEKSDAEDAINDAEDAIEDAEDEIAEADDDDEDVEYAEDTLDNAKDALSDAEDFYDDEEYSDAESSAKDAIKLAKRAVDRIGEEEDDDEDEDEDEEVESIVARIAVGETFVEVEYANGDDDDFTVDEDEKDDVIEAIADELNLDEDEVEDLIDFEAREVDSISVEVDKNSSYIEIEFSDDGKKDTLTLSMTDEDDILEALADRLDLDVDDVEDLATFY